LYLKEQMKRKMGPPFIEGISMDFSPSFMANIADKKSKACTLYLLSMVESQKEHWNQLQQMITG
jgi:hypothetical protein